MQTDFCFNLSCFFRVPQALLKPGVWFLKVSPLIPCVCLLWLDLFCSIFLFLFKKRADKCFCED